MESENKVIVDQFFNDITSGNIESAFALVSENARWWVPGNLPFSGTKTKSEYLKIVNMITRGFPTGFSLKVTDLIAEGDKVAAEVVSEGRHINGKNYNNHYHFLFRIKEGKFVEVKEYMDTLHLYQLIASK